MTLESQDASYEIRGSVDPCFPRCFHCGGLRLEPTTAGELQGSSGYHRSPFGVDVRLSRVAMSRSPKRIGSAVGTRSSQVRSFIVRGSENGVTLGG